MSRMASTAARAGRAFSVPAEFKSRCPPYASLVSKLGEARRILDRPMTLSEKILYSHLCDPEESLANKSVIRGDAYLKLNPDRVAMQDASAQTAMLQFMTCGMANTAVPASIHCDHLIVGSQKGAIKDLESAKKSNSEVFDFLESCGNKYGIQFWGPGSGIIHQIVLENFSAPGLMMLGTDSHTPNAGGLGAVAIGVGGADAVDALTGTPWELKAPKVLGVKLTGQLSGWSAPKDIITHLAGKLTVRGGTGYIIEYFGEGVDALSATGMATICNMGAEVGATTSLFPYNASMKRYLTATGRGPIGEAAEQVNNQERFLQADPNAEYDQVVEVNLSELEPSLNGPFTPDLNTPWSKFSDKIQKEAWPEKMSAGLIGSCTNSSYQDMSRVADLISQATEAGLKPKAPLYITPGSEQIRATIERDGFLDIFEQAGAVILANACGPCIGQWDRTGENLQKGEANAILSSYNRNFPARNDGNRKTMNFLTSPEVVASMAYSGSTLFDPRTDTIETPSGKEFKFRAPAEAEELPPASFTKGERLEYYPDTDPTPQAHVQIAISPKSDRLEFMEPFRAHDGQELSTKVVIKCKGQVTTDTISAAGPWLKYKGHITNISYNTLMGAVNAETGQVNEAQDFDGSIKSIPELMTCWKEQGIPWSVVGEHNYGEGSAREHAALSPRFLNGRLILVKSFARIHETNLKKQGMLPLTFANEADYDLVSNRDTIETINLNEMLDKDGANGGTVQLRVTKEDGTVHEITANHTFSKDQVAFFKAGSAINHIGNQKRQQQQA